MSRVLIIGGGGMVGQKLAARLLNEGLPGHSEPDITLFDVAFPPNGVVGATHKTGNLSRPGVARDLVSERPDFIFHLAAIVSGEAETDFTKGWDINMMSMWHLLEAFRNAHDTSGGSYVPKVVFTSSIAVFGGPFPDKIDDEFLSAPQTSYGAQKAISELMLSDFSRKGFVDGLSLRLPTICVRPGKANLAASSFFSGIIREPLNGKEAILPVESSVRHWHASPRSAAGFLVHAAGLDTARLEGRRALNLPGLSCTVEEQIEALRRIAGQGVVDRIKVKHDPDIIRIVQGWPRDFDPARAVSLGFSAESSFDDIIQTYIAEDLSNVSA
ncbi:D-erythronate dehydrogenase [Roseobacter fucihabitans]|uniref:D-erythronate dehydrogenase n=1 Tax=Roseobacter fucihabitans TaxID=1537242 RepID=A0ABZ2BMS8_9RHOB|nr:D-erythronate dehydrogenase [Roseobacter litoralis]MBC6963664.1 putative epimerase/dehydratase [Roseobacter litoralis]